VPTDVKSASSLEPTNTISLPGLSSMGIRANHRDVVPQRFDCYSVAVGDSIAVAVNVPSAAV